MIGSRLHKNINVNMVIKKAKPFLIRNEGEKITTVLVSEVITVENFTHQVLEV